MNELYDDIGVDYSIGRCTDPIVAQQLYIQLQGATRIVNIGAGTGSYEPNDIELVAVEPSSEMISQRKIGSHPVEKAFAESLPFGSGSFSHAMTVLSMHHWENRELAFNEINRVATDKFVAITWDPRSDPFWLTRDYFPTIYEMDKHIFPVIDELNEHFDDLEVRALHIPSECQDGFLAAFWRRPEAYLSSRVRQSISAFSRVENLSQGLRKLEHDLVSGAWEERNHAILSSSSIDVGYRVISAKVKA